MLGRFRGMTEPYTIWTASMKDSTHGGMAHRARYGEPTICGADAPYPTDRTEYKRVFEEAAKVGAPVYWIALGLMETGLPPVWWSRDT